MIPRLVERNGSLACIAGVENKVGPCAPRGRKFYHAAQCWDKQRLLGRREVFAWDSGQALAVHNTLLHHSLGSEVPYLLAIEPVPVRDNIAIELSINDDAWCLPLVVSALVLKVYIGPRFKPDEHAFTFHRIHAAWRMNLHLKVRFFFAITVHSLNRPL